MVQVKIFGLKENIEPKRFALSYVIQSTLKEAIGTPEKKRFQRFITLESENFIYPSDRTTNYTIIEIIMFEGRSTEVKKNLIRLLFQKIEETVDITPQDLEIVLVETPKSNWGIRGVPGDELDLDYKVDI
ncbi:tautomerase family protein [Waterburya agarophytonicola K14]|uniref:Tautomerase family protein n=1 Tax=Waterburya agarophytonicola KI4 TaxID=2874699 RepID=A0A964FDD6_9CYAN|nr:tautomerase family protein [Waterburya agarophytonicola]MCC0175450.1 tautomerase family protein [Waterburya agarophytonicola KI4]